jgi:hypothetical protein
MRLAEMVVAIFFGCLERSTAPNRQSRTLMIGLQICDQVLHQSFPRSQTNKAVANALKKKCAHEGNESFGPQDPSHALNLGIIWEASVFREISAARNLRTRL